MLDIRFEYDESFGPAYNYKLGYLEALKETLRLALQQQNQLMATFLKRRIEEQEASVFSEIPNDIKEIQGWTEEE